MKFIFLSFLIIQSKIAFTQTQNLVFEGAGIRGLAYSGAIMELEKRDALKNVKRVGGTSAGAITALLLSLGYNGNEIGSIINSTEFKKFNDGKYFFIGGIKRMKKYYGWYRGIQFEKWLATHIRYKTGNENINFKELKEKGFKELYIMGTCLNKQSAVIFSHESYPYMKVKDAVRISMSIPLYFEPVFIDSSGTIIRHPKNSSGLDIMIDGGILSNFPIKIFDSTKYFNSNKSNEPKINPHTLGFRIDRSEQIIKDTTGKGLAPMEIRNMNEYITALYNILIETINRQTLSKADWDRTISIRDGEIQPRIRRMSEKEILILMDNGREATSSYFKKKK